MIRLERRAIICLTLAAALFIGLGIFTYRFFKYGGEWATFYGNRAVYKNGILASGSVYDRNGVLLSQNKDGEVIYNADRLVRMATVHSVGDPGGNIATAIPRANKAKLIGYSHITGTYKLFGRNDDIDLTLDSDLCKYAYQLISDYDSGCAGLYNYKTGEILCLVSTPTFDPAEDVGAEDQSGIYINRFLSSTFTPGSIFKTVTAAAAIESGIEIDDFSYECSGKREVNGEYITCPRPHGTMDFDEAMYESCNCAFSVLTEEIGSERMKEYTEKFGLTKSYTFDNVSTAKGSFEFPSSEGERLNLGWAGIGQYHDRINPCSMMIFTGAIAGGGMSAKPVIIKNTLDIPVMTDRMMSERSAERLTEAMSGYGDTYSPGLKLYGKTGTGEVDGKLPNACFVGFLKDVDSPYAVIVCLENAGEAYATAAPIAGNLLKMAAGK